MLFQQDMDKVLNAIGDAGAFLTVKDKERVNTMTIGWGHLGVMWGKTPYFGVMVRPSRYTYDIIENSKDFTVSVPVDSMKKELIICGTKSGRELDKGTVVDFIPAKQAVSPVVDGCRYYFECRIDYSQPLDVNKVPDFVKDKNYAQGDFHVMYFGEIIDYYVIGDFT